MAEQLPRMKAFLSRNRAMSQIESGDALPCYAQLLGVLLFEVTAARAQTGREKYFMTEAEDKGWNIAELRERIEEQLEGMSTAADEEEQAKCAGRAHGYQKRLMQLIKEEKKEKGLIALGTL